MLRPMRASSLDTLSPTRDGRPVTAGARTTRRAVRRMLGVHSRGQVGRFIRVLVVCATSAKLVPTFVPHTPNTGGCLCQPRVAHNPPFRGGCVTSGTNPVPPALTLESESIRGESVPSASVPRGTAVAHSAVMRRDTESAPNRARWVS